MNEMSGVAAEDAQASAFGFTGSWREFAPIGLTNLLLTLVTLGIYRFWAKNRERQYLWSRTRFIDDHLEWTGSGKEMFIGFVLAMVLLGVIVLGATGLVLLLTNMGLEAFGILIVLAAYPFSLYIVGLARFRALRYRLSRTYWHGIRGGSDDQGFRYAFTSLWMTVVGALIFLLMPWSMITLWNERWSAMSFGPHRFAGFGEAGPLLIRMLLCFGLAVVLLLVLGGSMAGVAATLAGVEEGTQEPIAIVLAALLPLFLLVIFAVVPLFFYAAFFREAVGKLTLGPIDFGFKARTLDWLKLYAVDVLLVVGTLGIGSAFLGYRHWSFFIRHLEAFGEVNLDTLVQSETRVPRQGEGLLDAMDIGAV